VYAHPCSLRGAELVFAVPIAYTWNSIALAYGKERGVNCSINFRVLRLLTCVVSLSICWATVVGQEQRESSGTIEGTVIYQTDPQRPWRLGRYYIKDKKQGQLAEAVIGLRGARLKKLPAPKEPSSATIDQKNFRFLPETIAVRSGNRVKFLNSDREVHNVRTVDGPMPFNVNMPSGSEFVQVMVGGGGVRRPIRLGCSYHSAMRGWIFVFDHPYFQVTSVDGRFRLDHVPPGKYRLEMRHSAGNLQWSKEIEIGPGDKLRLDIRVSHDDKVLLK
jgi:plastocyanin